MEFSSFSCYHVDIKLPWVHNKFYKRISQLPFLTNKFTHKIITFIREIYWVLFVYLPEALYYCKLVRKHHIDIIHLNNIWQPPGVIAAKIMGIPCVSHIRDFVEDTRSEKFMAKLLSHHITISSATYENIRTLGIPENQISIIYDAIDLDEFDNSIPTDTLYDEFNITKETPLFGIFGRIVEWKGIREFILASQQVFDKIEDATAFIVGGVSDGDESYFDGVKMLASALGISKKIIFTGYRKDIPALMKLMDVVVHASIKPEPFGMVVIEAMAMKKPIVATRAGGPLDIVVDGETGHLVEIGKPGIMAKAIIQILTMDDKGEQLGEKGYQRVLNIFSKERYANQVSQVYEELCPATLTL